jgi:hypothetical protein
MTPARRQRASGHRQRQIGAVHTVGIPRQNQPLVAITDRITPAKALRGVPNLGA